MVESQSMPATLRDRDKSTSSATMSSSISDCHPIESLSMTDVQADTDAAAEERAELEWSIAELLSTLSEAAEVPSEFEAPPSAFGPDEVDFQSNAWMAMVESVQGWLRLPETLSMSSPQEFAELLVGGLGMGNVDDGLDVVDGNVRLSDDGLDKLRERAERARQLQQSFLEDLETDGSSVAAATTQWAESWEETPEEEEEGSGSVTAKAHIWAIQEFSGRAERGRLDLSPSYQRDDVWPTSDSQILIESILRGIPLPSVIILKPKDQFTAPFEVVDGKQRLTAILRFIGRHPRALEVVKDADALHPDHSLLQTFHADYPAFKRLWKNLVGEPLNASKEKEYYFPFRLRSHSKPLQGALAGLQGKYYTQIRLIPIEIAEDRIEVQEIFESGAAEYKIPVLEYSRATRRQIHEVFNLYNRQGKHLNAEEIRNALFHNVDLMRGLMVTGGDSGPVEVVAPFLLPKWDELSSVQSMLDYYSFGRSRYRRTKVLSWIASILFVDSTGRLLSTAKQIDSLLERIETAGKSPADPLADPNTLLDALCLMQRGMTAHSAIDEAWAPVFKDTKQGAKWQELQLVASLIGVTIAASILGDKTIDALEDAAPELRMKTALKNGRDDVGWRRPKKTQTATQWEYIATVAMRIVEELGVDPLEADTAMKSRFGFSGVASLRAVYDSVSSE
ncbi:DUF262 domain-containing protein [Aeromicrobium sp.]|uniref:DUF262 domain-containing protein n=1 Tax=Aeromicrobium sp. TaxID=1871063 RepID=UPI002FCB4196